MSRSSLYGKPKQLRRASELIGKGLEDIALGRSNKDYSGIAKIFNGHGMQHDSMCTPDCKNRIRGQEGGLIADIMAPQGERLAVIEHRMDELKINFDDHRAESIRAGALFATKEEVQVVDIRIDRDIMPAIGRLETRSTLKTAALVISILGLFVSMAYNAISLYAKLHP